MDENNQPIVYVLDTRNADHRTTQGGAVVPYRPPTPIGARVVTPAPTYGAPVYGQPRAVYLQQPAPSTFQSWLGNMGKGEVLDLILQGLVALTPPPDAPNATGDTATDLSNLMQYQAAVVQYEKRDEQLRTLGYGVRKLIR